MQVENVNWNRVPDLIDQLAEYTDEQYHPLIESKNFKELVKLAELGEYYEDFYSAQEGTLCG